MTRTCFGCTIWTAGSRVIRRSARRRLHALLPWDGHTSGYRQRIQSSERHNTETRFLSPFLQFLPGPGGSPSLRLL